MTLSTQPPKGTKDWYPDEFRVRKYIFDMWRKVCVSFGYEEYLGPLVEDTAIREAKSGEDVGGSELTRLTDREGNISDLALRPEMTPTVTRMVTAQYPQLPKPIRWFSIANFYRNERPQRGRNREFWQLNVDMFGDRSEAGMIEVLQLAMELMLVFNPPKDSRKLSLNHRGLINAMLDSLKIASELQVQVVRTMDKFHKLDSASFDEILMGYGLSFDQSQSIRLFLVSADIETVVEQFPSIADHAAVADLQGVIDRLTVMGYGEYVHFDASLMRGFDYYDGVVFEVFDKHPQNNRALFGGGRYDGLSEIFGSKEPIPAMGFAPGDETMKLFLQEWGMLDKIGDDMVRYYIPLISDDGDIDTQRRQIARDLRSHGHVVEVALSPQKVGKAFQYADKTGADFVVLVFPDEVKIKNMKTGEEKKYV